MAEEEKHKAECEEKVKRVLAHKKQMAVMKMSHDRTHSELQDATNALQSIQSKLQDSEADVTRITQEKKKVADEMERGWKHVDHLKCLLEGNIQESALHRADDAGKARLTQIAFAKSEEELLKLHKHVVHKMTHIEELEAEVKALQEEERIRTADELSYATTIKTLREEVSRSEAHARAVEGESLSRGKGLFGQLDQLNRDIKANEARHIETVKGHEEKYHLVTTELNQTKADLAKARAEIDKDEHLLEDRQAEIDKDVNEIHDVKAKLSSAEATVVSKDKQLADAEALASKWESEYNDTAWKLAAKEKEAEALISHKGEMEEKRAAERVEEEKKLADKNRLLEMRTQTIQALEERLGTTEEQLDESRAAVQTISEKLEQKHHEHSQLHERHTDLNQQHADLHQKHQETKRSLAEMTKTAGNADSVMAKLNKKITILQEELHDEQHHQATCEKE